jgi:endonuclease/exonuclease/phosphatase (EEP) superfamily protein YafD
MQGVMGIPIDHVLASAHWRVVESQVGPDVGSDHFPVAVVLQLK